MSFMKSVTTYRFDKKEFEIENSMLLSDTLQARVVQKVDNAIHRINHYPVDSVVCFVNTYPLDSDLSGE